MDVPTGTMSEDDPSLLFPYRRVLRLEPDDPQWIGRYRLVARLPAGGSGAVPFIAEGEDASSHVLIKALPTAATAKQIAALTQEAANLARLKTPRVANIVSVDADHERPHYAQEFIAGTPLSEIIDSRGALAPEELRRVALGLLWALRDIHSAGVVHRDVKPGNIVITPDGEVVLVDFGISRITDDAGNFDQTSSMQMLGSGIFVAPERMVKTEKLSRAVDVFGWGMVVAAAALGDAPIEAEMHSREGLASLYNDLRYERANVSAVPEKLRPHVRAALAGRPEKRPTVTSLLSAVESSTRMFDRVDGLVRTPRPRLPELLALRPALIWVQFWLAEFRRLIVDRNAVYYATAAAAAVAAFVPAVILVIIWHIIF